MDPLTLGTAIYGVAEAAKDVGAAVKIGEAIGTIGKMAGDIGTAVVVGKEVGELGEKVIEAVKGTKAFEAAKEALAPRHIPTINENLKRTAYPGTSGVYKQHTFQVNGEKVEGVFPKFPSRFETVLPKELRMQGDDAQFRYCTQQLAKRIEANPSLAVQFTPRQLKRIQDGAPRISGLTWHHNEVPGKMQLVDAKLHDTCRHTGGRSIWGGGVDHR